MGLRISVAECMDLYRTFTTSVWRWEQLPAYSVPDEEEPIRRWKAGEPDDLEWLSGWLNQLRDAVATGRTFQRVRRLDDPPTEYQRWVNEVTRANIAAGEVIRHLTGTSADLGMPDYDFLLIDDALVAEMVFDKGRLTSAIMHDDAPTVERHRAWRDWAWQHSSPADEIHQRSP